MKYILILAFILFSFAIYWSLKDGYIDDKNLVVSGDKKVSQSIGLPPASGSDIRQENKAQEKEQKFVKDFTETSLKVEMVKSCGLDSAKFMDEILKRNKSFKDLSEKQMDAFNKLENECLKWFDYLSTLGLDKISQDDILKLNLKDSTNWNDKDVPYKEKINSAISALNDEPEIMGVPVLLFLLEHDPKLIKSLIDSIGTSDPSIITYSKFHIATMYQCLTKSYDCSSDSNLMLRMCIYSNEERCGQSYEQYVASIYSPNQFVDIQSLVFNLRHMILEGYPNNDP